MTTGQWEHSLVWRRTSKTLNQPVPLPERKTLLQGWILERTERISALHSPILRWLEGSWWQFCQTSCKKAFLTHPVLLLRQWPVEETNAEPLLGSALRKPPLQAPRTAQPRDAIWMTSNLGWTTQRLLNNNVSHCKRSQFVEVTS